MRKSAIIVSFLILMALFVSPVSASAETKAGIKPGSFFYFFDTTFEKIGLFFTFNPQKKAEKALEYADERLAEAEAVAEEKNTDAVKTAVAGYESNIALAAEESSQIKDKGKTEELLNSIAGSTSKHQEILSDVLSKVPEEAKEAIIKAIEASKKGQEEATKQIAELKGEIEKLKKEVAELKAKEEAQVKTQSQSQVIEKKEEAAPALVKPSTSQTLEVMPTPKPVTPTIQTETLKITPTAVAPDMTSVKFVAEISSDKDTIKNDGLDYATITVKTKLSNEQIVPNKEIKINGQVYISDSEGTIIYKTTPTRVWDRCGNNNQILIVATEDGNTNYSKSILIENVQPVQNGNGGVCP